MRASCRLHGSNRGAELPESRITAKNSVRGCSCHNDHEPLLLRTSWTSFTCSGRVFSPAFRTHRGGLGPSPRSAPGGFPVNICYASLRGELGPEYATYSFDRLTFVESSEERTMRHFPREASPFWVEVILSKGDRRIETRKYRINLGTSHAMRACPLCGAPFLTSSFYSLGFGAPLRRAAT